MLFLFVSVRLASSGCPEECRTFPSDCSEWREKEYAPLQGDDDRGLLDGHRPVGAALRGREQRLRAALGVHDREALVRDGVLRLAAGAALGDREPTKT